MVSLSKVYRSKEKANLDHDETGTTIVGSPEVNIWLVARDVKALDASGTGVNLGGRSSDSSAGGSGDGEEGELHLDRLICFC